LITLLNKAGIKNRKEHIIEVLYRLLNAILDADTSYISQSLQEDDGGPQWLRDAERRQKRLHESAERYAKKKGAAVAVKLAASQYEKPLKGKYLPVRHKRQSRHALYFRYLQPKDT
jgi:hypothetical protein